MKKLKSILLATFLSISVMGLASSSAQAVVILNINGGGQLTGAQNLDINGTFFDVIFTDGTCVDLFGGCNQNSDFDFFLFPAGTASAAAQAIKAQVFQFSPANAPNGELDFQPELTFGCESTRSCTFFIPDILSGNASNPITYRKASNNNTRSGDGTGNENSSSTFDTALIEPSVGVDNRAFALFSPSRTSVPEPGVLGLFAVGLVGLGFARRRRTI